jgi:hypothetical protein
MRNYNFSISKPYSVILVLLAAALIVVLGFIFFVVAAAVAAAAIVGASLYRLFSAKPDRTHDARTSVQSSTDEDESEFSEYKLIESTPHTKKEE